MNLFIRSLSGLTNYSIFTKKDITAFCEGGTQNITVDDALGGNATGAAEDIVFWDTVCAACSSDKTFHIKAIGDCYAIEALAKHIIKNNLTKICVFTDLDWRNFSGDFVKDKRVIYTPQYSWENMVARPDVIAQSILAAGHFGKDHAEAAHNESKIYFQKLLAALRWPIYLDISSIGSGASFVEKSETCNGSIKVSMLNFPVIDRPLLRLRVNKNRHKYVRIIKISHIDTHKIDNIPGHVIMGGAICVLRAYVKRNSSKQVSSSVAKTVLLQSFRSMFSSTSWKQDYSYIKFALSQIPV